MKKTNILLITIIAALLILPTTAAADYIVSQNDELILTGTAQGNPGTLKYYIFGTNYFKQGTVSVDDNHYTIKYKTDGLAAGDYIMIIQHPMYDKIFNVEVNDDGYTGLTAKVYVTNEDGTRSETPKTTSAINTRQNANAAYALIDLINLEYHDDTCTIQNITVTSPAIQITSMSGITAAGYDFTITGNTNLRPDTIVTIEITSTGFTATGKSETTTSSYISLTTKVIKGYNGTNYWTVTAHDPKLTPGDYLLTAKTANGQSDSVKFTVTDTLPQTPTLTTAPTEIQPAETPATQTTTPASPGFGIAALIALAATAVFTSRRQ